MCDKSIKLIPEGLYCYNIVECISSDGGVVIKEKPCPYWMMHSDKRMQENGYCEFLNRGDWEVGAGLLWDKVKECGIKVNTK